MRTVGLLVRFSTEDPHRDFPRLADFGRFPLLAEDVRAVAVHPGTPRDSDWEVNFRRGVMRWNEWESIDADRLRIEFGQTEGDFAELHGFWQLMPVGGGCEVRFEVTYDFGIESLAGIMDPIAERVVKRVSCSVLTGLFGEIHVLEGGEALVDLAVLSHSSGPAVSGLRSSAGRAGGGPADLPPAGRRGRGDAVRATEQRERMKTETSAVLRPAHPSGAR